MIKEEILGRLLTLSTDLWNMGDMTARDIEKTAGEMSREIDQIINIIYDNSEKKKIIVKDEILGRLTSLSSDLLSMGDMTIRDIEKTTGEMSRETDQIINIIYNNLEDA